MERGRVPNVSLLLLNRTAAVVGLDLSARLFPGGSPVRDAVHGGLLEELHGRCHSSLGWRTEVPLPTPGDQRAWDALIRGPDWREGVEAEMGPRDGQALARRLMLKQRDGSVAGVILLLPKTRRIRTFSYVGGSRASRRLSAPGRVDPRSSRGRTGPWRQRHRGAVNSLSAARCPVQETFQRGRADGALVAIGASDVPIRIQPGRYGTPRVPSARLGAPTSPFGTPHAPAA
jgi:hypothetical protein